MFRQPLLLILLSIAISCGQNDKTATQKTSIDSTTATTKSSTQDTITTPADTSTNIKKPQAYREDINNLPSTLTQFIKPGYTVLDTTAGDLNLDSYPDMIMVLKKDGEETTSDVTEHPEKRPLLILLGRADQTYQLAAESNNAVYCIDCGGVMGDPFMDIVIKKGYFSVEHYGGSGWRWTRTITFKYSPDDSRWYLHKDGGDNFHAAEPEKVTTKVRTVNDFGKVPFDKFDIYKED